VDYARTSSDPVGGVGQASGEHGHRHLCLPRALHALGVPVAITRSGPFRALGDGNRMLSPFSKDAFLIK